MWIFTTIGFFSIVAHRDRPAYLLVRARVKTDLEAFRAKLPPGKQPRIQHTPDADYHYRLVVKRGDAADTIAEMLFADPDEQPGDVTYDNFKNAVLKEQGVGRAHHYHRVWDIMHSMQTAHENQLKANQ